MKPSAIEQSYEQFCSYQSDRGLLRHLPDHCPLQDDVIDFSHNDYLGLSHHPAVIAAGQAALQRYGAGATGSRLLSGNLPIHVALETLIAKAKGTEDALVFNSGYQANATVLAALLDAKVLDTEPLVFTDRLNHASLHHGCQLAGIRQIRYRHNDMAHLRECLIQHHNLAQPRFIVAETVFGMDGDCIDMPALTALALEFNVFLYLDEAHATGVMGPCGYGLCSHVFKRHVVADTWANTHSAGVSGVSVPMCERPTGVAMGTLSKALGVSGAYIACSSAVKNYLINKCSGFIFSTAPSPAVVGAAYAAFELLPQLEGLRTQLQNRAGQLRAHCHRLGLNTGTSSTHIVPIITGSEQTALHLQQHLQNSGCRVSAIRPPTVPRQSSRIRIALSGRHDDAALKKLTGALSTWRVPARQT